MKARAFTQSYQGVVSALPTPVFISKAYNPNDLPDGVHPQFKQFTALWDTGAEKSVITKKVADEVNIFPNGKALVYNANGSCEVNTYLVGIGLPNNVVFPAMRVSEGELNGFDILIGMDVIGSGDFSVCQVNGHTKFSFQVPSTHDIDFVEELNTPTSPIIKEKKPRPNDPCPCGSGKKYKNCHGKS